MKRMTTKQILLLGTVLVVIAIGSLALSTSLNDEDKFPSPLPGFSGSTECINGHFTADPSAKSVLVYISAYQWRYSYCSITVFEGQEVTFMLKSVDIPHGMAIISIPGVDSFISPSAVSTTTFIASEKGEFEYFCTVFCGEGHPGHVGKLIVK
ncbi:MAG: hypothetical protein ACE5KG_02285 [Nitrososphaerales archaeon]